MADTPPELTLECPTTGEPFGLGMAVFPGAMLTLLAFSVVCSSCGEDHSCILTMNVPTLAAQPE